ncbi:MAG: conjugal transfer protein TraF [Aquificota bacterium]|nr:conjugal transfer protein TraF [Aquificota bacterium]
MRGLLVGLLLFAAISATATEVELLFFYVQGCSVCAPMKEFLDRLSERYPELKVISYETALSPKNYRLMIRLADAYGLGNVEVPVVFVGDLGVWGPGAQNELLIEEEVQRCLEEGCPSPLERVDEGRWLPLLNPLETAALIIFAAWVIYLFFGR